MRIRISTRSAGAALAGVALYASVAAFAGPSGTVDVPNANTKSAGAWHRPTS